MLEKEEILQIFKECQAILEGHFLLSSGLHSPKYIQCAKLLQYPEKTSSICKELVDKIKDLEIDVVISPAIGGIIVGYEIARYLNVRAIFTEREDNKMCLRRGFSLREGEKVLLVEDVVTTGGSILEVMDLVKALKGEVVGLVSLINRGKRDSFSLPLISLVEMEIETYEERNCPLCKENIPLVKPGSRKI